MQGGCVSASACLYARKEHEESMSAQCSRTCSSMFLGQPSRRTGGESNADTSARNELKLLSLRRTFIIFRNIVAYFSRLFASSL